MTKQEIEIAYNKAAATPSDINQHLPKLKEYADKCDHVTEMGVRGVVSTWAFLNSNAKKVIAIDIFDVWTPEVKKLKFICGDTTKIEIEQTDFLFIDTLHTYLQLKTELELHAKNVRKYIGFHDTQIFGNNGEDGKEGLMKAINEFLVRNIEWEMDYTTNINNGLTIIKRKTFDETDINFSC